MGDSEARVACEKCGADNPTWRSDDRARAMCNDCINEEWLQWALASGDPFALTVALASLSKGTPDA